jgi:hypothetical protein
MKQETSSGAFQNFMTRSILLPCIIAQREREREKERERDREKERQFTN